MAYTLDEFAADCRRILKADPGPAGLGTTFVAQFPALVGAIGETVRPEVAR